MQSHMDLSYTCPLVQERVCYFIEIIRLDCWRQRVFGTNLPDDSNKLHGSRIVFHAYFLELSDKYCI